MKNEIPVITLTTDFGLDDGLVASVKGVLLQGCPYARLVDICNNIPPQDIISAAVVLEQATDFFPPGTVHLVVVDPEVGTARKALVLATPKACFVGPDNGVLELVWRQAEENFGLGNLRAFEIKEKRFFRPNPSPTFHGRDIFAPVAAALARGVKPDEVGPPARRIKRLELPEVEPLSCGGIKGEIITFDGFGNAITNITKEDLEAAGPPDRLVVFLGRRNMGKIRRTFADVPPQETLAYLGSSGRLELALRNGNLAERLGLRRGHGVQVLSR